MKARHRVAVVGSRRILLGLAIVAGACALTTADRPQFLLSSPVASASDVSRPTATRAADPTSSILADRARAQVSRARRTAPSVFPSAVGHPAAMSATSPAATRSATPTAKPKPKPKSTPSERERAPAPAPAPKKPAAGEKVITSAYLTGYSYYDNTPPGSSEIAFPGTRHDVAAGTGTYEDPITLAVGWHEDAGPQWPVGSRFYLPFLHKYVIVEDLCGDEAENGPCYQLDEAADGATTWLDVWTGGEGQSREVSDSCMGRITAIHTVVHKPADDYPVNPGDITSACSRDQFWGEGVPAR